MDSDYQRILAAVRATVAALKQQMSPSYAAGGPPDVYLPGGEHVVRPVLDSTGELFRHLKVHRTGWEAAHALPGRAAGVWACRQLSALRGLCASRRSTTTGACAWKS